MATPLGSCPNCHRPVFGSERRCFCGFDLRATIAGWQRQREDLAAAERDRAGAAERARQVAAEAAERDEAEAERRRAAEAAALADVAAPPDPTPEQREQAEARAKRQAELQRRLQATADRERDAVAAKAAADAEAQRQRDAAADAAREAGKAEAEAARLRDAEAARLRDAEAARLRDAEAARLRDAEAARLRDAEAARESELDAERRRAEQARRNREEAEEIERRRMAARDGIWGSLKRHKLLAGAGAVVMMMGGMLAGMLLPPRPPQHGSVPVITRAGTLLGQLHGLPQSEPGAPTPYAMVSAGQNGQLLQHPLPRLHLGAGRAVSDLAPDRFAQLPPAQAPLGSGFDLPGFLLGNPTPDLIEERAAQRAATGDWALARLLLRWSMEQNPRAGTALGRLYDPNFAGGYSQPFRPDPDRAAQLYEAAAAAGDTEAARLLAALRPPPHPTTPQRDTSPEPPFKPDPRGGHPPPQPADDHAALARAAIAKGATLGLEISRGWHRIQALHLLVNGVRIEARGDPGLAENLPAYQARLGTETTALDQEVAAYLATLRELQALPPDLLPRAADLVKADPAYAGAPMAQAIDHLLAQVRELRDQPNPDRQHLLQGITENQ
jgi:chemotaxis protein histidine kinase CheA